MESGKCSGNVCGCDSLIDVYGIVKMLYYEILSNQIFHI